MRVQVSVLLDDEEVCQGKCQALMDVTGLLVDTSSVFMSLVL